MPDYLTPKEMAERYRGAVTVETLANWRSAGSGPAFLKIGGKVLYDRADVESWEASRRQASGDQPAEKR